MRLNYHYPQHKVVAQAATLEPYATTLEPYSATLELAFEVLFPTYYYLVRDFLFYFTTTDL